MTSAHDTDDAAAFAFAFAVCQVGAEAAVKAEVAQQRPDWRFAFSRPGLVTWKCAPLLTLAQRPQLVFARLTGASLGRADGPADVAAFASDVAARFGRPVRLSVFERDVAKPGDEPPGYVYGPLAEALAQSVWPQLPGDARLPLGPPAAGDIVLDVAVARDEPWLVGVHEHARTDLPYPGARPPLRLPEEAPSRAWLKLEEGLLWSGLAMNPGHVAVEIGSAPGGASFALLTRGLRVVGVDPGAMAESVLAHAAFMHLPLKLGDVRREQLPRRVDWLLMDVNLAPQVALHQVRRLVSTLRGTLRGALFTLKLNEWRMAADVPDLLLRVRNMGFSHVQAMQLPSNRQEICVAARMQPSR